MKIIRQLESFPEELRGGVLSIGKFDGVHTGHAAILECVKASSRMRHIPSIVFTFDPSPSALIRPNHTPPLLCTTESKIEYLREFDLDAVVLFPTTKRFLELSAREFFRKIVVERLCAQVLVEGGNFMFGNNREGTTELLQTLCRESETAFQLVDSVVTLGREVSSSVIRGFIREGRLEAALGMLGRPYRLTGLVVHGECRGRTLGYPTANLAEITTLVPKPGLYAASVEHDGKTWLAAVNIGGNPTFGVETTKIEAHLLDYDGNLYGERINVDFFARIRDVVSFASKEELLARIPLDLDNVRRVALMRKRS